MEDHTKVGMSFTMEGLGKDGNRAVTVAKQVSREGRPSLVMRATGPSGTQPAEVELGPVATAILAKVLDSMALQLQEHERSL